MDFSGLEHWATTNWVKLATTLVVLVIYVVIDRFSTPRIEAQADHSRLKEDATDRTVRLARFITALAGGLILAMVWGVEVGSLMVIAGTALTLLGVALFANWSLLSNVTAYFILLLHPSFRRGTFVRLLEGDNYVEGYIADLNFFSTRMLTENRETIVYPNNLVLGRTALINPRDRLNGVGKLPATQVPSTPVDDADE
ncbi:MAG: mechanosensitive ion channel domain-containing protein [Pseudomonadota bacterium]